MFASRGIAPVGSNRTRGCTGPPGPGLPIALVAPQLGDFAGVRKRQAERRRPKLLDQLAGVRFVARRGCQLVVNRQAHIVSLLLIVQRPGQSINRAAQFFRLSTH